MFSEMEVEPPESEDPSPSRKSLSGEPTELDDPPWELLLNNPPSVVEDELPVELMLPDIDESSPLLDPELDDPPTWELLLDDPPPPVSELGIDELPIEPLLPEMEDGSPEIDDPSPSWELLLDDP